jgi:membrane protein insertase Oxa1/YidC/SpoIIIJ
MLLATHRTWGARGTLFRLRLVATATARVQQQQATPHLVPVTFSSSSAYREHVLMSPTAPISMAGAAAIVTSTSDATAAAVALDPVSVTNAVGDATALVVAGLNSGFPTWYPHAWLSYGLMRGMGDVVSVYGVEWWVAIAGVSIALRPLTVPPALFAQRTSARFAHYKDEMAVFSARIADANKKEDKGAASQAIADYRVFMANKNLNVFSGMLIPIITQAFVFISMFSSIRWLISDAALIPGFMEGGKGLGLALLTVPDPSFVIPGVAAVMTAASVWFNPNIAGMPDRGLSAGGHRLAFTGLSTLISAISCFFPAVSFIVSVFLLQ